MVQKLIVEMTDDMDGGKAAETVRFGLGGNQYEIDLNKRNATGLRKIIRGYADKARVVKPGKAGANGGKPARTPAQRQESAKIRAWASQNGYPVNPRGRIPESVTDAYRNAQLSPAPEPAQSAQKGSAGSGGRGRRNGSAAARSGTGRGGKG